MGISELVVKHFRRTLVEQERDYAWLSRVTGISYKRLLAEVKNGTSPMRLETAIAVADALGADLSSTLARAA